MMRERWDELRQQFLGDFEAGLPFAERSAHADAWASHVADLEADRDHWKAHVREVEAICAERGVSATDEHGARVHTEDRVRLVLQGLEARVAELEASAVGDAPVGVGDRDTTTTATMDEGHVWFVWTLPGGQMVTACRRCQRVRQANGSTDKKRCRTVRLSLRTVEPTTTAKAAEEGVRWHFSGQPTHSIKMEARSLAFRLFRQGGDGGWLLYCDALGLESEPVAGSAFEAEEAIHRALEVCRERLRTYTRVLDAVQQEVGRR